MLTEVELYAAIKLLKYLRDTKDVLMYGQVLTCTCILTKGNATKANKLCNVFLPWLIKMGYIHVVKIDGYDCIKLAVNTRETKRRKGLQHLLGNPLSKLYNKDLEHCRELWDIEAQNSFVICPEARCRDFSEVDVDGLSEYEAEQINQMSAIVGSFKLYLKNDERGRRYCAKAPNTADDENEVFVNVTSDKWQRHAIMLAEPLPIKADKTYGI